MNTNPSSENQSATAITQDVRGSGLSVASGSPPGLFNLYVRHTDGRMKKLTGYAMTHHECCVMKSKLSEWSQARTLLVKETK